MPHLLVLNRSYPPDLGATGQLLGELCGDLAARYGWEVTVVAGPPAVSLDGAAGGAGGRRRGGRTRYLHLEGERRGARSLPGPVLAKAGKE